MVQICELLYLRNCVCMTVEIYNFYVSYVVIVVKSIAIFVTLFS